MPWYSSLLSSSMRDDEEETLGRFLLDVLINSAVIIVMFLIVQRLIAAPFQVVGHSMVSTLQDGEYIIVSKLDYLFGDPKRGDIIVFHPPEVKKDYYIKRIMGIPGDEVRLKAGKVSVNGQELEENYLKEGLMTCLAAYMQDCANDDKVYKVPEGKYFVLGDNRSGSSDSRAWFTDDNKPDPFVDKDQIQGKTRLVVFPPRSIRLLPETKVFEGVTTK